MSDTRWGEETSIAAEGVGTVTVLLFEVGGERQAVPLDEVEAVALASEIRTLPQPPQHVVGVIQRGGEPVPVVDLAAVLSLPKGPARHVLLHRGTFGLVGFVVHSAAGVGRAVLRPLPAQLRRGGSALIGLADVGDHTAYLLDLGAAVPPEMQENYQRSSGHRSG